MEEIQYIGEQLLPRQLGHLAIVGSFVAALLSVVAYFLATRHQNLLAIETDTEGASSSLVIQPGGDGDQWHRLGRAAFLMHGVLLAVAIGCVFYVMIAHRYEYFYAHSHTNPDLSMQYVFAAFWEGQEGSFMLWLFWHFLLGGVLIWRSEAWERPTMTILMLVQVFLGSMILGLHFGWGDWAVKWGSNPILLLRETQGDIPLFRQVDYVAKLPNTAKGLSPLLQNYWMTIHPPTLFLGFASTTIPFCFAVAGLWTKRYTDWLRWALPYVLFSAAILGLGILMGGAWAYEALSFNGYWAWDPVENMSLVPWLTLVAGLHTHLVARVTGQSIRATIIFYILTFLLILYSTFLTRSGILGDTSAHAFTEMGLTSQLVIFQGFFLLVSTYFLVKNYRQIPTPAREETTASREFWMFMGSLVLLMSVVLMSFTTSIPVYNKIFELFGIKKNLTSPVDIVDHHNRFQLWIAILLGLLSGFAQYFRFKADGFGKFGRSIATHLGVAVLISSVLTFGAKQFISANAWQYLLMLFAGIFTVVTNVDYLITFLRGNLKMAGSAFSHIGLGILIVGILASGLDKTWISKNRFIMESFGFKDKNLDRNILIHKGKPTPLDNGYNVTYVRDTANGHRRDFTIEYRLRNEKGEVYGDPIVANPYILYDRKTGKVASTNPDTKHFLTYDIFSHIAALPPEEQEPEEAKKLEDSLKYQPFSVEVGKTIATTPTPQYPSYEVTFLELNRNPKHPRYVPQKDDVALGMKLKVRNPKNDSVYFAEPLLLYRDEMIYQLPVTVNEAGMRLKAGYDLFDLLMKQQGNFKEFEVKQGEIVEFEGVNIQIGMPNTTPKFDNFESKPNDIAFGLTLDLRTRDGKTLKAEPDMVIRDNQPIPLADEVESLGMRFLITKISPEKGTFTLNVASNKALDTKLPLEVAMNVPISNYVVLEATINPGINLVWLGCLLMLAGFVVALVYRIRTKFS